MPELPEVETVKRGLEQELLNAKIMEADIRRPNLRIPFPDDFIDILQGSLITKFARRAKYLLMYLDTGNVVITHLGMSGTLILRDADYELAKHDHVALYMEDGRVLVLNDHRRFGLMTYEREDKLAEHRLFVHLGVEPLEGGFTAKYLAKHLAKRKADIKPTIMDQKIVVGVGNIYACEALFNCGINPQISSLDIAQDKKLVGKLVTEIKNVLIDAIESGGSTLQDYKNSTGESGYFQHKFKVYGREGDVCYSCKSIITKIRQAGRSTFMCKTCQ